MSGSQILRIPKGPFLKLVCFPAFAGFLLLAFWPGLRGSLPWLGRPAPGMPDTKKSVAALVSIRVRNADVREVLRTFAHQIGARLALDPSIRGTLSIRAHRSDLSDVMNDVCEVYSCEWSHSNHVLTVSKLETSIQP